MKELQRLYTTGDIGLDELVQRIRSWEAHLLHGDTYRLRRKLFDRYVFIKGEEAYRAHLKSFDEYVIMIKAVKSKENELLKQSN